MALLSDVLPQMSEKTEVAVHDIMALTQALDVPCSAEAASCILLNVHAACKLGQSGQLTKKDLASHDAERTETILNVKVSLPFASQHLQQPIRKQCRPLQDTLAH